MSNVDIVLIEETERIPVRIGNATFYVRRIDQDKEREMRLAHMPAKEKEGDLRARFESVDGLQAALLDYALVGWKDVLGPGGTVEAPCTPENKRRLPSAVKVQLVNRAQTALGIKGDGEEEQIKN